MTPGLQWCQELDDREEKEELRWVGKSPRKGRQEGDEVVRGMVAGTVGFCAVHTTFTSEPFNSTVRYGYFFPFCK